MSVKGTKSIFKDAVALEHNLGTSKKRKIVAETLGNRLAKQCKQGPKSSFEADLERLTQKVDGLKDSK